MKKFRFNSVTSITFKIIKGFFLFINNIKITDLIMMYFFGGVLIVVFSKMPIHVQDMGGGESYSICFELQKFSSNIFNDARYFLYLHTCVCVRPRDAASSARSGRAKYCVRWKRLFSCCNCRLEYIVLGFLIFLPFPLIRSSSIWDLSAKKKKKITIEWKVGPVFFTLKKPMNVIPSSLTDLFLSPVFNILQINTIGNVF